MILCSCNVISDQAVRVAQEAGAGRVREVFQHCGRTPKCGKCIRGIRQELETGAATCANAPDVETCEPVCA